MKWSDALRMAFAAIRAHKLRSSLTLVGIVAGVASIIGVMTGISVVQAAMEEEMSVLGSRTFQVQKWPRGVNNGDVDWRKINRRKPVTLGNTYAVREHVQSADMVGAELWQFGSSARYGKEQTESTIWIVGGTPEYPENNTHLVEYGRNISREDVQVARKVAVIGFSLARQLFPFVDPLDRTLRLDGRKYTVVGVFQEKKTAMGGNFDNYVLIPVTAFTRAYGLRGNDGRPRSVNMTVRARTPELVPAAIEETRAVLRMDRGVDPREEDDFFIFTNDSQIKAFNDATAGVKIAAFIIGIIALVVAGIGIMNIMLVSVTERTREIGVRKAVGARRRDVLRQFLFEAIVLCNVGGIAGVVVGFALGNLVSVFTGFAVTIPWEWAVRGLLFCSAVGLIFGMWPAIKAARLVPIDAIGYE